MQNDLTVAQAAQKAKLIYQDMIVLVRNNVIPSYMIGRNYMIKEDDLISWLDQRDLEPSS